MSEIRSKYPFLAMANLLGGGFLVVAVFAFPVPTAVWLGFAVSIPLVLFGLAIAYSAARGLGSGERIGVTMLGTLTFLVASWTIVASLVFAPPVARWLIFASACAHVALSMASLVIREVTTERVVHHLEVGEREPLAAH
ncbi:MAG: hypothetical protein ACRDPA_22925 [Solirubrobacteraceae bacterium]